MARAVTKPPPPRYKIVERDGRLITIDNWAKKSEPSASSAQPPLEPRRRDIIATGGGIGESLVAAVLRVRDDQGRRLLTTSPNWDRKGPRVIALSPAGERRLGGALLAAAVFAMLALLVGIIDLEWLLPIAVILAILAGTASSARTGALTRLLDTLGEELPR